MNAMGCFARRRRWVMAAWAMTACMPWAAPGMTLYVDPASPMPRPPFRTMATAAHTIQDAVDAAAGGDVVRVAPGRYDRGGREYGGQMNRVVVEKAITVRSIGGAVATAIVGARDPAAAPSLRGCGPQAVRCVVLAHPEAKLVGFRITGGATLAPPGEEEPWDEAGRMGGGVLADFSAVVRQCIIDGNAAGMRGGGLRGGMASDCTLSANWAPWGGGAAEADLTACRLFRNVAHVGGGAYLSALRRCSIRENVADCECENPDSYGGGVAYSLVEDSGLYHNLAITGGGGGYASDLTNCDIANNVAGAGGGAAGGTLRNCTLLENEAQGDGGGTQDADTFACVFRGNRALVAGAAYGGKHYNALMTGNRAVYRGGGASHARLYNCTIAGNRSVERGGGTDDSLHVNTIVYDNQAEGDPATSNWKANPNSYWPGEISFYASCTTPLPPGPGNLDAPPRFATSEVAEWMNWAEYRLVPDSPCVDAGSAAMLTNAPATDLDGLPRMSGMAIDIGAYEHPAPAPSTDAIYVDAAQRDSPAQTGSRRHPFGTIQAGIDHAAPGGIVVLRNCIYRGDGNKNLSFRGKPLVVQAETNWNAAGVAIDCESDGRGFVFDQGETDRTVLRGLAIRNGMATNGGAIHCSNASPLIADCVLEDNVAFGFGGAVYAEGGRGPRLANCRIQRNTARIVWAPQYWGGQGAGIYSRTDVPARIEDSKVAWNKGESTGQSPDCGAVQGAWEVVRCSVSWHTNAPMVGIRDAALVEDCEVNFNSCGVRDVAFLRDSRVQRNWGAGMCFSRPGTAIRCRIERNDGPGVRILDGGTGTAHVAFSDILENGAAAEGRANLDLRISDCRIAGNGRGSSSGMGYVAHERCVIAGNGSVGSASYGALDYESCLVRGNRGPAFDAVKGGIRLNNCTVVDNGPSPTNGPTLFRGGYNGWIQIRNSILWNNGAHLYAHDFQPPSAFSGVHSIIQHSSASYALGEGSLDVDPQFVSGVDFRLRSGSPALGAGHSAFAPVGGDLTGQTWGVPPAMGAYALPGPACPVELDVQSWPSPAVVKMAGGGADGPVRISWDAHPGYSYALWRSTNLLEGFQPALTFGSGSAGPFSHEMAEPVPAPPQVFYQLRAIPAAVGAAAGFP